MVLILRKAQHVLLNSKISSMISSNINDGGSINDTNSNHQDGSGKSEASIGLEEQQTIRKQILQHFSPEFIEKQKQSFLFFGAIEALKAGTHPYTIIQELLETLADIKTEICV